MKFLLLCLFSNEWFMLIHLFFFAYGYLVQRAYYEPSWKISRIKIKIIKMGLKFRLINIRHHIQHTLHNMCIMLRIWENKGKIREKSTQHWIVSCIHYNLYLFTYKIPPHAIMCLMIRYSLHSFPSLLPFIDTVFCKLEVLHLSVTQTYTF